MITQNSDGEDTTWEYMYAQVAKIVNECGPRAPCSKEEKQAAELIKNELHSLCNDVREESFKCHPRSFDGWPQLSVVFCLISIGIFLFSMLGVPRIITTIIASGVMIFLMYCVWRQFFNYEEFVHRFIPYKEGTSQNVYGIFPASETPKKRIIFAAHYDSSFRFNLIDKTDVGYAYFITGGIGNLISVFVLYLVTLLFEIINRDTSSILKFLFWVLVILNWIYCGIILIGGKSPKIYFGALGHPSKKAYIIILGSTVYAFLVQIFFQNWLFNGISPEKLVIVILISGIPFFLALFLFLDKEAGPGVIDNLSAVGVCFGIAHTLKNYPIPELLKDIEIIILFTGAEEAGDRGAEAFAREHAKEFNQIDTTVVNLESLSDSNLQKIEIAEETTRVKCDPDIYTLLGEAAKELGIKFQFQALPSIAGGTDVAHFIKGGFRTSGLEGIRYSDYLHWYHTDRDSLDLIHLEKRPDVDNGKDHRSLNVRGAMMNAYRICMKYIEKKVTK
jgi:hypothetical protein